MNPQRRRWLQQLGRYSAIASPLAAAAAATGPDAADAPGPAISRGRVLRFPRDHGAHLNAGTEWWYVTGWLATAAATGSAPAAPVAGFQVTFFRSRTGLADGHASRFAARQLLFAHAALTLLDGAARPHRHDQRLARWNGDANAAPAAASSSGGAVRLAGWQLVDETSGWRTQVRARDFSIDLQLARTQPLLLQGEDGFSRKGPQPQQASHYVSEPQLQVSGSVDAGGRKLAVTAGRAWLDHEWSDAYLHPDAVGWDWIGINLFDGSALTAFVLRRADGSALWAGGSWRRPGLPDRSLRPDEVALQPLRRWRSPASAADYPVQWQVSAGGFEGRVQALADAQEMDAASSTGTIYWEGLSELLDRQGRRVGLGYLEMTGYAGRLRM